MDNFLSQEEIDALLNPPAEEDTADITTEEIKTIEESVNENDSGHVDEVDALTDMEKDALGEIGNISMGSASTALSELLNQKVVITTPRTKVLKAEVLYDSFVVPYLLIDVNFTEGLIGSNILVIKNTDASIIADLMMGGTGTEPKEDLDEIQMSAVAEAMNQMIGSAATAMSTMFGMGVVIAPPIVNGVDLNQKNIYFPWDKHDAIAVISFDLHIGDLIDSEIMQVLPIDIAKEQANFLLNPGQIMDEVPVDVPEPELISKIPHIPETQKNIAEEVTKKSTEKSKDYPKNLDLILDIPLKISVILGKTKKPINDVLRLIPGSIVELEKLANETVDILANGTLIAEGEVVVINENYGVRVTNILSPEQRLQNLKQ